MDDTFPPLPGADIRESAMKTIYILLTRSGTLLSGLPQRQNMDFGGDETVVSVYLGLALGLVKAGVRQIF